MRVSSSLVAFALAATGLTSAFAAGIDSYMTTDGDRKIINIGGGITYTMKADDVAAIGNADIVKLGSGTLITAGEMANYTGNIFISNGCWRANGIGALGTKDGQTYVDGGSFCPNVSNSVTGGGACTFLNEIIHLKGTGFQEQGAIKNLSYNVDICRTIILEGDTLIEAGNRLDLRFTDFTMNGYTLTTRGDFRFVALTIVKTGDVVAQNGYLEFQGDVRGTDANHTVTLKRGVRMGFWDEKQWLSYKFNFEDGTRLSGDAGAFKYAGTDNRNILWGGIELQGALTNRVSKDVQVQMRGHMTGPGGIVGSEVRGGWLQFLDSGDNDFKGGVAVQGVYTNADCVGGLLIYKNGAIPSGAEAGPVMLTDAMLHTRTISAVDLPDLVVNGKGVVTNDGKLVTCNVKSLVKTGDGELAVHGPLHVKGDADIRGGAIRCAKRIPNVIPGLHWSSNTAGKWMEYWEAADIVKSSYYQGIASSMYYAYNNWPNKVNGDFCYHGYFKVPGEEGADVRCRFISCIFRSTKVLVDDRNVLHVADSAASVPSGAPSIGWSRHYWSDPVMLKAGWHKLVVAMDGNYQTGDNGPHNCTDVKYGLWPWNFGLGVDFNSTDTPAKNAKNDDGIYEDRITNVTSYVKFEDKGDGSFLRATTNANIKLSGAPGWNPNQFRPSFDGNVAFAGGTVFDLNDYEPYTVMTIPSLTGLPTIRNGAVNVTSTTWTIRPGDLDAGVPLTVETGATLTFGGARKVLIDGDGAAFDELRHMSRGKPIFAADDLDAYDFTLSENLSAVGFSLGYENGVLKIFRIRGLNIIVK